MEYASIHHNGREEMLSKLHGCLDEADVVVTYNGKSFDTPVANREFLLLGLAKPAPYTQVDLYRVVRSEFRFASNKLDHIVQQLGIGSKVAHPGHTLWQKCLEGDEKSWNLFRKYNKQDVVLLEELYDRLLPWIPSHPNRRLYGGDGCPKCSGELAPRGYAYTNTGEYRRYRCRDCGAWSRDTRRVEGTGVVSL